MNIHIDLMASKYSVDKLFHASISSEDEISITNMPCRKDKIVSVKKKSRITDIKKSQSEGFGDPVSASGQGEKAGSQASSSNDCSSSLVGNLATGEYTITERKLSDKTSSLQKRRQKSNKRTAELSSEELEERKKKRRLYMKNYRAKQSKEATQARLQHLRQSAAERRDTESEQARKARLQQMRQHAAEIRDSESELAKEARLQQLHQHAAETRDSESELAKEARLQQMRQHAAETRDSESELAKEARLQQMRQHAAETRDSESELTKEARLQQYTVLLNPKSELVKGAIMELSCKVELIQTRISKVEGRMKEKGEPLTCSKKKLEMFLLEFLTNELRKTQRRLVDLKRVISPDLPLKEDLNDDLSSYKKFHVIEEESSDFLDVGYTNEDIIDKNKMNEYDRESKVRQITCRIKEEVKKIRASAEKHRYIHVDNKERHDAMINDDVLSHNLSVKIEDESDISEKFESHSFTETQNSISPVLKSDSPHESYECLQCHKKFVRLYHFRYHMATHEKSAYQCSICQRSYETVERLKKHVRLHSLKRPHECLECKKRFVTITGLNVHKRLHTGERPYKCTMCHKTFRQQSHLKTHIKSRHLKEKTRQCQRCKKTFENKSDFLSHVRKECSVKRHYTCPKCKVAFNKKKTVLRHMSHGCD